MDQTVIFQPVIVLAFWTLLVLLVIPFRRLKAAFQGQVTPEDFRLGESPGVPPWVSIPNRNYMNLLELPILFYVACLVLHATGRVDALACNLAWAYVGLRIVHSLIHLTVNHVVSRLSVFAASNVVLAVIWVRLAVAIWP